MKRLLLLATLCVFAAAMVPRPRRAVNTEEEPVSPTLQPTFKPICAAQTPCGWAFYRHINVIESHVTNAYCVCDVGRSCQVDEDDPSARAYVKKCRPLSKDAETMES